MFMKMQKWIGLLLILVLLLTGCKSSKAVEQISTTNWQEQYNLGVRYLSEGNYQEAIIAFTAAIEIDPKQPETYAKLASVYEQMGDIDAAISILEQGISVTGDNNLTNLLDALNRPGEIGLTDEAKTILDEFYHWIPEGNYSHLGDFAREYWNENNDLCIGYGKSELWGACYDGRDPSRNLTGIGLKIINEYCWYYGPLENGVPQGEGICVGYRTNGSYVVYEGGSRMERGVEAVSSLTYIMMKIQMNTALGIHGMEHG